MPYGQGDIHFVKIFLGVFIILLVIIGNTIVITVLSIKNIFTRYEFHFNNLAAVDLLVSMVDIPLAFNIIVASLPDEQLHRLSLVGIGQLFYIACFFLFSFHRNDALRKSSSGPACSQKSEL